MIVGQYIAGSNSKANMKDFKQKRAGITDIRKSFKRDSYILLTLLLKELISLHNITSLGKEFHSLTELTK